jgi:thioesterase domain-containing protein
MKSPLTTDLTPEQRAALPPDPTNGWSALAGEPVEVHEMAADHYSMLVPPAVAGLTDRLRSCIERSLDAAPRTADGSSVAFVPQAPEARS